MRMNSGLSNTADGRELSGCAIWGEGGMSVAKCGRSLVSGFLQALGAVAVAVILITGNVRAADHVIVVDVSGSMADAVGRRDSRVRIAVVQEALEQYPPALPSGSRVNLVAFNRGIVSEKEIRLSGPKEYAEALAWAGQLPTYIHRSAPTYLWTTLRHALKTASRYSDEKPDQPVTVRVLTDDEDNERNTGLSLDRVLHGSAIEIGKDL